ncbi:MAG TPA: histidinol-phosphate transaminase [Ignavibacteria bacterium]|nr:aspartate aminotransferase [Bacteroidota bacterium]HRI84716.1 histidinol-phosphate transaminase [Ignavibacteria bacterium]HRK00526.1 histidinol-phosphate transaminase [Ignavibacteria bacterium]
MNNLKYKTIQYLDRNESQYGPSPKCFEYLKTVGIEELAWYSRDFSRGVKSKLSERIAKDFGFKENQIIISYGSEDILKQLIHRYLSRGEKVLIPKEAWWYYKKVAYEVGGFNVEYPMKKGKIGKIDSYLYDLDKMIKIYDREKPRIVIIASPNNPTGNMISGEDLGKFLDVCRGAIVMIDEAYWGFGSKDNSYVKPYIDEFPNLIICRTFSKYFALAGTRMGFSFAGNNLEELKGYTTRYLGYNLVSENLSLIAYDDHKYYEKVTGMMQEDKEYFYSEFKKMKGFTPYKSFANFMLVDMPAGIRKGLDKFLKERNLLIKFLDEEAFKTETRITLGTRDQNYYLIDSIKEYLKKAKH